MKLNSKRVGDRLGQVTIQFSSSQDDTLLKEEYGYCETEYCVADYIVKDGYNGFLGIGIFENNGYVEKGISYMIKIKPVVTNEGVKREITFYSFKIKIKDEYINLEDTLSFSYILFFGTSLRYSIQNLIKDMVKNGTIAKILNSNSIKEFKAQI